MSRDFAKGVEVGAEVEVVSVSGREAKELASTAAVPAGFLGKRGFFASSGNSSPKRSGRNLSSMFQVCIQSSAFAGFWSGGAR